MMGYLWAALVLVAGTSAAVVAGLVNDELRGWLELLPHGILRLAASRLSTAERSAIYETEWLPELSYILKAAGERPITRLVLGTEFSIGILLASKRIERNLDGGSTSACDDCAARNAAAARGRSAVYALRAGRWRAENARRDHRSLRGIAVPDPAG